MLKDKEFIGRVCRMTKTNKPIDFSVSKIMRSKKNHILGFEISTKQGNAEQAEIVLKDEVKFQLNDRWVTSSELIIHLLEVKINSLRRQIKISTSQRKKC